MCPVAARLKRLSDDREPDLILPIPRQGEELVVLGKKHPFIERIGLERYRLGRQRASKRVASSENHVGYCIFSRKGLDHGTLVRAEGGCLARSREHKVWLLQGLTRCNHCLLTAGEGAHGHHQRRDITAAQHV